ncbi:XrtA/PEP-CTERM system-associated ATPase [Novosphingobium sp.]|uniref:XrtA/PEP-CTERM system-associated ATPase n=1 Tax=Novosphingobium sp. TaxID=1874826 RepID=UPI0022C9E496|nr:XrtA/PEP-CTERM system-associated ATPase [Novosphingobium sp.]MCZ8017438.1 XrtA-associated ATPase [Novosphingobium sp.]MCZ8034039.1 XrtA-associated ATPase [Novosphingobium sp.]MCZ8051394.1 XrtA-associated ATPase [Novosphingobium sp.]MCZ8059740.1 XrtA-associated ATPase [Novosphingobium sp.]MCZ8231578.1 XrtA-associated ATPase [Novosphingobium sp.]
MFNDFYGLTGRPFQLTPDPAFYFESLTHRKALSYLSYGLAQGEGFVVITGEVGAGKSTLVAHLMATIDPARLTAAQIVTSKLDGEELVHVVAQAFGLIVDGHDKASALGAIEAFLHDEARAGRRCLLVVDESQNLQFEALEELRMLSNFQLGAHPLLQTLLLGQPEFRDTIQGHPQLEQLRQRVIAAHHLEAMELGEVQPYIEHRLKCVGWTGNPQFDQRVFTELYEASGGVPRRINQICNRLMMLGAVEQRTRIDGAMLSQVLDELEIDGTLQLKRPAPQVAPQPAAVEAPSAARVAANAAPFAAPVAPTEVAGVALAHLQAMLAERDAQIAELQQAVIELANEQEAAAPQQGVSADVVAALENRFEALEAKMIEQERTIRHTLTMLIEWIEAEDADRAAA